MSNKKTKFSFKEARKRDGRIVSFDIGKIENAVYRAGEEVGITNFSFSKKIAELVIQKLERKSKIQKKYIPSIEEIQDTVEQVLIDEGQSQVARAYIIYRQKRAEIRKEKAQILNKETIDEVDKRFDANALRVLVSRYLKKDANGKTCESPKELFTRVATHTVLPSLFYDEAIMDRRKKTAKHRLDEDFSSEKSEGKYKIGKYILNRFHFEALIRIYKKYNEEEKMKVSWSELLEKFQSGYFDKYEKEISEFYKMMAERRFMPNTPALANFGNIFGMGSACFVLGVEDSIESIMDTLKNAATIFKSGGGVGYNFSKLRPEGDFIKSSGGVSSGPISFMSLYDKMADVIKQGGIRRGANMGILNSNHPDIENFIKCKSGNQTLKNFNISILILPEFWECLKEDKPYPLVNPKNNQIIKYINAKSLFDLIVYQAWESAEPGVIFHDKINEYNPLIKALGPITCTNPCGEVLLYPFESCNLGSINLWSFVKPNHKKNHSEFDWDGFGKIVETATRFLDNVVDVNKYPLYEIQEMSMKTRKIGLGVMGLADALYELGIAYDSSEGLKFMEEMAERLNYHSKIASIKLSQERGRFPLFDQSFYSDGKLPFAGYKDKKNSKCDWRSIVKKIKKYGIRNSFTTVIAPTGSISMIAGCSSGIEPNYSLVFEKNVVVGNFYYVNPVFERILFRNKIFNDSLLRKVINNNGSVKGLNLVPEKIKKILVTSMDISPESHIKALAALQKWVDSSISKTNNLPADATPEDIKNIYLLAYKLGCKDVTVFRDKSIQNQVLIAGGSKKDSEKQSKKKSEREFVSKKDDKAEGYSVYYKPSVKEISISEINPSLFSDHKKYCPSCHTELVNQEKCHSCPVCGWGMCS